MIVYLLFHSKEDNICSISDKFNRQVKVYQSYMSYFL